VAIANGSLYFYEVLDNNEFRWISYDSKTGLVRISWVYNKGTFDGWRKFTGTVE
jgi:hypothetical protein